MIETQRMPTPGFTASAGAPPALKKCRTCKEHRLLSEFPRHNGSRDGRRKTCKACLLAGRYQPYVEPPEVRARRAERERKPKWRRSHRRALARYAERNPAATRAQRILKAAVKAGRVPKAERCQVKGCMSRKFLEAHHHSYEKPLEILWCCAAHHRQGHAQGFIVPADEIPAHYGRIPDMAIQTTAEAA
jgi:hypothetical protein